MHSRRCLLPVVSCFKSVISFNLKVFLIPLMLGLFSVEAQQYTKKQEFSVMNPNSFEMTRFGLTPVNQYTGKASVSFPMFEMQLDGKSVPFSLSYDTGGVRVSQEATWAGLGWNLGGIPVITHQIHQKSDIGNLYNGSFRDVGYCFERVLPQGPGPEEDDYFYWIESGQYQGPYGEPDTQPDVFVANLSGGLVKFQLTQRDITGTIEVIILNDSNAKVVFYESNRTFDVTDEDGYRYEFRHIEYNTSWSQPGASILGDFDPNDLRGSYSNNTSYGSFNDDLIPSAWYVDKIVSPDGDALDFIYDYEQTGSLNVTVSHPMYSATTKVTACGRDQNNGNVANGWQFGSQEETMATRTIQEIKILSEVVHSSTGTKAVFRTTPREDLFGWETGPGKYLEGFNPYNAIPVETSPKKLSEIELYSSSGKSIKKVTFQHSYFNAYKQDDEDAKSYLRLKLDGFRIYDQQYAFKYKCADALPKKHSKSIDFWGFYNGFDNFKRTPSVLYDDSVCLLENPEIYNQQGEFEGATKGSRLTETLIGSLQEIRYPTGGTSQFEYGLNTVTFDTGSAELTPDDFNYPFLLHHTIEPGYPISGTSAPQYKILPVGGLRVETVTNRNRTNNQLLKKSYNYSETVPSGDEVSSGRLMDVLRNFRSLVEVTSNGNVFHSNVVISTSSIVAANGSAMGSHLGYSQVEEVMEDAFTFNNNGVIVTKFINEPNESLVDEGNGYKYLVQSPPVHYEDTNGKVVQQEMRDNTGQLKRSVETTYQYREDVALPGYKLYYNILNGLGFIGVDVKLVSDHYTFNPKKYIALTGEVVTTDYLEGNTLVAETSNEYNTKDRIQATENKLSGGVEEKTRTEYYYPYDSDFGVNANGSMGGLVGQNRINAPVYTRSFRSNKFIGHEFTRFGSYQGLLKPEGVYFGKEDSSLGQIENRVQYQQYDAYGNLCQYRQSDGTTITAIWGYDGQYIVARIENAIYSDVEGLSGFGDDFDLGGNGLSESQKATLQNDLPNAQITLYDHDPMVGPTLMTDIRGYETSYEYDAYNRLVAVKDEAGNLLEDYQYKFADVRLYPEPDLSECFNPLNVRVTTTDNRTQYVNLEAEATGGVGAYEFAWYLGVGTSNTNFQTGSSSNTYGFNWIICCNTVQYVKVEVTSGTQTASTILRNPNYDPNCAPDACDNPF